MPVRESPGGENWAAGTGPYQSQEIAECQLTPVLVGQFECLEWTEDNHLRHSKFLGVREDKQARDVGRE